MPTCVFYRPYSAFQRFSGRVAHLALPSGPFSTTTGSGFTGFFFAPLQPVLGMGGNTTASKTLSAIEDARLWGTTKLLGPENPSFLDVEPHRVSPGPVFPPYHSEIAISENKVLESRGK